MSSFLACSRGPRVAALILAFALFLPAVQSEASTFDETRARTLSQAAVGEVLGNHVLRDSRGGALRLESLRGRPLVVSLIYTGCYGSCGIITKRLAAAVEVARDALGANSFTVITVGFDAPADSPKRMASYARTRSIGDDQWRVLSTDAGTARALAADLGFSYVRSPRGFDHVTQTTVVDASGRVYRQIYGDAFPTPALVEPLKELIYGTAASGTSVSGWVNGLKLLCTVYDPSSDRYRFDYSVFVAAITGVLCLGGIAVFVIRSWGEGSDRRVG